MNWLATAEDNSKWDATDSDFHEQQAQTTSTIQNLYQHDDDNPTNNTRANNVHDERPRPNRR